MIFGIQMIDLAGINSPVAYQGKSLAAILKNLLEEIRSSVFSEHKWHDYETHERMVRMFPIKPDDIADQVVTFPFQIESPRTTGNLRMNVSLSFIWFFLLQAILCRAVLCPINQSSII